MFKNASRKFYALESDLQTPPEQSTMVKRRYTVESERKRWSNVQRRTRRKHDERAGTTRRVFVDRNDITILSYPSARSVTRQRCFRRNKTVVRVYRFLTSWKNATGTRRYEKRIWACCPVVVIVVNRYCCRCVRVHSPTASVMWSYCNYTVTCLRCI